MMRAALPVLFIATLIVAIWYAGTIALNSAWALDKAKRAGTTLTASELIADTMNQEKPRLPAPHQVSAELWKTTGAMVLRGRGFSKRSLINHAWVTFSSAALGFALGTVLGVTLAVGITYSRVTEMTAVPLIVASQMIPILAVAPIIVVVLNSIGVQGLLPKSLISMYMSFFPVAIGMAKGLRSPDPILLDQMRTWNATHREEFVKLRLPSSVPYLFTSMKIAIAASLVGAIVGELPTGAVAGLGARLLAGSYYGQTIQIWSALFAAAILAACLVGLIGLVQRLIIGRMEAAQ